MSKFTGNEGELVTASVVKELISPFQTKERAIKERKDNLVHAEFFGIKAFQKLINQHENKCVGFRVYYGTREEDHSGDEPVIGKGGLPTPRLIIIPVDCDGNDLTSEINSGIKDMAPNAQALMGGPLCPHVCGK